MRAWRRGGRAALTSTCVHMPIRPYLGGRAFAPQVIAVMSAAFEDACKTLGIGVDNPTRAMVAQVVISLVEDGKTDADQLAAAAVQEMRGPTNEPA